MESFDELKNRRVNDLVLNSSYQSYTSNHIQKQLQNLDQLNRLSQSRTGGLFGSTDHISFDQNSLLVVALSTIVMLAKKKTVSEKNYMYTKLLLESVLDENGLQLANVPSLLAHMKYVYIKNKVIADDGSDKIEIIDIKSSKTNEELVDPVELEKSLLETTDEFLHHAPLTNSTPKTHRIRIMSPSEEEVDVQSFEPDTSVTDPTDNKSEPDDKKSDESTDPKPSDNEQPKPSDNDPENEPELTKE